MLARIAKHTCLRPEDLRFIPGTNSHIASRKTVVRRNSDAAGSVGEVEPDFYAAEVGTFGADGSGDAGAEVAGRADVAGELGVDFAELGDFVHGGGVDFFLGVEASAHGPLVEEMEERAGFDEANGFGVRKKVEGDFGRNSTVEKLV